MGKKSIKVFKKINWFKFLVTVIILAIGLVFGINLVQKNQETRSFAYDTYEDGGGTAQTYVTGRLSTYNSAKCKAVGGKCAKFAGVYSDGVFCKVTSFWYSTFYGRIKTGLCDNDPSLYVMCCAP